MPNYLYNGYQLPSLPEWDKETYPVAYIYKQHSDWSNCVLVVCSAFKYRQTDYDYQVGRVAPHMQCSAVLNGAEWSAFSAVSTTDSWITPVGSDYIIWTNTDILSKDGSIALPASDPVPVGGEPETPEPTLTNRDLYRKINGKPTKLTLYKKLGGKLIPLDEHTKEVKT